MGFRFRKSKSLGGGFKLNAGKKGLGISGGIPGARLSLGPNGVRGTVGIPGSGVSFTKNLTQSGGTRDRGKVEKQEPQQAIGPATILGTVTPLVVSFFLFSHSPIIAIMCFIFGTPLGIVVGTIMDACSAVKSGEEGNAIADRMIPESMNFETIDWDADWQDKLEGSFDPDREVELGRFTVCRTGDRDTCLHYISWLKENRKQYSFGAFLEDGEWSVLARTKTGRAISSDRLSNLESDAWNAVEAPLS